MKSIFYTTPSATKALFFLFFLAFQAGLNAQATLSVQGVLTKSDGTAVEDGNDYALTFRLWKSESGTSISDRAHIETIENISIVGGVYSVVLGLNPDSLFQLKAPFNQTYWLGVSVNTSTVELLPRPRLTHAPYALGIVGQNNIFPSTGTVIADALNVNGTLDAKGFRALGGTPTSSNGYSFSTGDTDGGIFSLDDNNVSIYANAVKALEATNAGVTIPGTLYTNNVNPITANGTVSIGGNETVNGNETVTGNSQTNGFTTTNNKFLTPEGYSFSQETGYDSGMFPVTDGWFQLKTNNVPRFSLGDNLDIDYANASGGTINITAKSDIKLDPKLGWLYLLDIQGKPGGNIDPKNLAFDKNTGRVFWENSSRRYKHNIRPLVDDFSLILKAQPRVYNRFVDGLKDTLYNELGYIAEEMDSIGLHKLVERDIDGIIDGFDYQKTILYAIEVLKIQDAAIADLRKELEVLKAANAGLQTENSSLRTENGSLSQQQSIFNAQLESLSKRMQLLDGKEIGNSKK